jgi:protein-S-isoprenylcysteine O-methyltransferase Ste14
MTSKTIYNIEYPWIIIVYILILVGSVIFVLGAIEMDPLAFLGIKKAETDVLSKKGIHGIVRHPLYLGVIIVYWSFPTLKTIDLVGNSGLTLYLIIGAYLEERKLIEKYGKEYREYKSETPMLIPKLNKFLS